MAGYYGFILDVRVSVHPHDVRPSVFSFVDDNLSNIGLSPDLVCALILWRSGLQLLIGKFHQYLTELSARYMIVVLFHGFYFSFACVYANCLLNNNQTPF